MKKSIVLIIIFLFVSGCGKGTGDQIKAPGIVEGEIICVKSKVAAEVNKVYIREGEKISMGSDIVSLDSRVIMNKLKDIDLNIEEMNINLEKLGIKMVLAKANKNYFKKKAASFERLNKRKSVSGEDLEKVRLRSLEADTAFFELKKGIENLNVQKRRLETRKDYFNIILEDYSIISKVDGFVLEKFVTASENVFPGMILADILDSKSLYIEIFIEEVELYSIKPGQAVKIVVDGFNDGELTGSVAVIGKKAEFSPKYVISEIERKALLYKVKVRIEENINIFKIGMPVTVIIEK